MRAESSPRFQGRISIWKDAQGYGFITPNGGGDKVFVHIQSFAGRSARPAVDDLVTYRLGRNEQGKARAEEVDFAHAPASGTTPRNGVVGALVVSLVFLLFVAICVHAGKLPALILGIHVGMSLLTYLFYAHDKSAARDNRRRTPEDTLHLLALLGGWPGALVAQQTLRHKSIKQSFRRKFWLTAGINCVALFWLCSASGARVLRAVLGWT